MKLKREFFTRHTIQVARELLGKILVLKNGNKIYRGRIVETEAYIKTKDDAAHFNKGLTDRTRIIGEAGGHIYIYNIYGMYQCFNVVAEEKGILGGALIRGIEPLEGIEDMYINRYKRPYDNPKKRELINLTNGPAKLVMAYGITKDEFYGADLTKDKRIWIENREKLGRKDIIRSPRINIDYAQSKDYLLRFYIRDNLFISKK